MRGMAAAVPMASEPRKNACRLEAAMCIVAYALRRTGCPLGDQDGRAATGVAA
jgi:hypothetical protein